MQEMLIGNEWIDHTVLKIFNLLQSMFGHFKYYVSMTIKISEQKLCLNSNEFFKLYNF